MEDKKVTVFRSAAFTVMDRANKLVERENGEFNKESLVYNLGYNAGVLDLVKQLEEDMAKAAENFDERLRAIREQLIMNARNDENDDDSDIEDYLGGND